MHLHLIIEQKSENVNKNRIYQQLIDTLMYFVMLISSTFIYKHELDNINL
jgi:hypothetical protein